MNVSKDVQHMCFAEHALQHTESNSGRLKCKVSDILGLPSEILQLILYHMDAQTFSIALLTCKAFWNAGRSKSVLLRHLGRMQGLREELESLGTNDLFLIFRHRAAVGLLSASVSADVTLHRVIKGASLLRAVTSHACGDYLASVDECGRILVYHLFQDGVVLDSTLLPRHPDFHHTLYDLTYIAFSASGDVMALYKQTAFYRHLGHRSHSPDGADLEGPKPLFTLFTFKRKLTALRRSSTTSWSQSMKILECHQDDQPVGLAMASDGTICVALKDPAWSEHGGIHLMMYGSDGHSQGRVDSAPLRSNMDYYSAGDLAQLPEPNQSTFDLRLAEPISRHSNEFVLVYNPGEPVYSWSGPQAGGRYNTSTRLGGNHCKIKIDKDGPSLSFMVDIPFHGFHTMGVKTTHAGKPTCQTTYLAIGLGCIEGETNAFIVRAESENSADTCLHLRVDLTKGLGQRKWQAVALLAGWRKGSSSLRTPMAISPKCTKIVAADWSRLLMWSVDPELLHQADYEEYFPKRDYNVRKRIGRIRPIQLCCPSVVYRLTWLNENTLYATSDQGIVRWNMDHESSGRRHVLPLASGL